MSKPNPNSKDNGPPETPPSASASEGTQANPSPLQQQQMSAVMDDINQLWAPVGGRMPANTSGTSAATPSAPTSPTNAPAGPSGAAISSLQPNIVSSSGASASPHNQRPSRARAANLGPGQHRFQLQRAPTSTAVPSTGSLIQSAPPPPPPAAFMGTFKSTPALKPWEIYCKCSNRTAKPHRHWKYHCPDNNKIKDLECELCGQKIGRPDNLTRHREQSCLRIREGGGDEEEEEDDDDDEESA